MLDIEKVDHVGIRVSDKETSVRFYRKLGFVVVTDAGFDQGHPIILQHPSGVVLNLLGPSTAGAGSNVLMDQEEKLPGITHFSYRVRSIEEAKAFLTAEAIALTGQFSVGNMQAVFIRDPDRNVIELDAYVDEDPGQDAGDGFRDHP